MSSDTLACVVYMSELEAAWLKRFLHHLSASDHDNDEPVPADEVPIAEAAQQLREQLGETSRGISLSHHIEATHAPAGSNRRCSFYPGGANPRSEHTEARLVGEALRVFLRRWRSTADNAAGVLPTIEVRWTGGEHDRPLAGIVRANCHAVVELDFDDLGVFAQEQLEETTRLGAGWTCEGSTSRPA